MKYLLMTTALLFGTALPAHAQESKEHPPAKAMEEAIPEMKSDTKGQHPPTKAVGEAVPEMKGPGDVGANATAKSSIKIAPGQEKEWIDRRLYDSKGKEIGEISQVFLASDGTLESFHADIGGFIGFGEMTVLITADKLAMDGDKLVVSLTEEEAKKLPEVVVKK